MRARFPYIAVLLAPTSPQHRRATRLREALRIKNPQVRLKKIAAMCKGKKKCLTVTREENENIIEHGAESKGCGAFLPQFRRTGMEIEATFHRDDPDAGGNSKQSLSAERAFKVLQNISEEDAEILGFDKRWCRPEWLLIKVLPVPPPPVRPTVIQDGALSQDDLTHVLVNIIKTNKQLEKQRAEGQPAHVTDQTAKLLQMRVANFFDNGSGGMQETQRSGKILKTIAQRIKGKEGRIRGNLMGKRVDYSARTVITADPNLSMDQVGVPKSIARNLTVPEIVTPYNIEELHKLVAKGPDEHPGAKSIIKGEDRVDLRFVRSTEDIALEPGWTVERHLRDDDVIVFNRQPSLHKMSIMCHKVKVLDWSTFRLNLAVTSPYNADFDGDEMNLHVPQSLTARAEAGNLMRVSKLVVSPQSNEPVMSIVQDSLVAVQRMTKRDTFIPKDLFFNTLMWIKRWDGRIPVPAILKPVPLWTGKQVFSIIIPNLNYKGKTSQGPPKDDDGNDEPNTFLQYDDKVLIHDGELIHGVIDKKSVGSSSGGLIHLSYLEHGSDACRDFMDSLQVVVNYWILNVSLSVGVKDTVSTRPALEKVAKVISEAKASVTELLQMAQMGDAAPEDKRLSANPGQSMMETFEDSVHTVLDQARQKGGLAVLKGVTEKNNFKAMAQAGSKGKDTNIQQIMACVGAQKVEGSRLPFGFRRRTLPHFRKDDLSAESKGFVTNSFLKGLTAQEFYFHAMGGREGLIDTACKTSVTGYLQRRLVKAMESVMCQYDGTVRNSEGNLVQTLYGEDGLDATFIEKQTFPSVKLNGPKFRKKYELKVTDPLTFLTDDVIAECRDDDTQTRLDDELHRLMEDRKRASEVFISRAVDQNNPEAYMPVNIDRLIWRVTRDFKIDKNAPTSLSPKTVINKVNELCSRFEEAVCPNQFDPISMEVKRCATELLQILVRSHFASKVILKELRLTEDALNWIIGEVLARYRSALVAPGEMCGVIAAQSIGQPATQMTLNTFHLAGVGNKNVTAGVPRLNEILNIAKSPKTPQMDVYLREDLRMDESGVPKKREGKPNKRQREIMVGLEMTVIKDLVDHSKVFYDPDPLKTVIEADEDLIEDYSAELEGGSVDVSRLSQFMLRMVFRKDVVAYKGVAMTEIADTIEADFGEGYLYVMVANDNADELVLRIRLQKEEDDVKVIPLEHEETDRLEVLHLQEWLRPIQATDIFVEGENGSVAAKRFEFSNGDYLDVEISKLNQYARTIDVDETTDVDLLKQVEKHVCALKIRGVPRITKVYSDRHKKYTWSQEQGYIDEDEIKLTTDGTNLLDTLSFDGVDPTRTTTNDINELFMVFGIEGTRTALFLMLRDLIVAASYVNSRHFSILCDVMTFRGTLMAINRHGINRVSAGPMLRCSFEETLDVLFEAALFGRNETLNGVTENIMCGQLSKIGTGCIDLILDQEKLKDAKELEQAVDMNPFDEPWVSPVHQQDIQSPIDQIAYSPMDASAFSPLQNSPFHATSPSYDPSPSPNYSPEDSPVSPMYTPAGGSTVSPAYSPTSPAYSPTSPGIVFCILRKDLLHPSFSV